MSKIPQLKDIVLKDTPFAELMNKRIYNVLLIATKYDAFMLEDDGRVDEQIFNEYTALSLRYPPRFTQVTTRDEALRELSDRNFELIIVMPNMDHRDIFSDAKDIKQLYPHIPIVVLTPFSREVSRRVASEDMSGIDYVFSWLGNAELLLAIIKLIEDKWNAPDDTESVGVQIILLVEDSIRFYSSALPHLYKIVLEQSREFSKEALNDHLKTMRMRGRPKIMLARTYEEATEIYRKYKDCILGIVSDMSFIHEGKKDPLAGFAFGQYVRNSDPCLPIILESSEADNDVYAHKMGASFIPKRTKSYPQDLRREIMKHFGFGPFIILDPHTGKEIMRIQNLQDLQRRLYQIPDDALRHHLSRNHFSRFFFSRAMFPPAVILKNVDVNDYDHMDEARHLIADLIVQYRKMKNAGVVAIYQRDRFDRYSDFARIGNGSLGGKGRGLAFMGTMVKRYPSLNSDNFTVGIPKTVVICTDIFDEFMETNNLYPIALSDASDEEILHAFETAKLPERVLEDLLSLFKVVEAPIAVRSSSLLEDSHYQPFAGVYSTYMIPKTDDSQLMLAQLRSAIKAVYASVFYRDSKAYLTATQNLIDQEKMAVVLQEVVGSRHSLSGTKYGQQGGDCFYPTVSGVARSLNFYPVGDEKPEEGTCSLAFGLGKYIVDGGLSLRLSPAHPRHIMQLSSVDSSLRETQRHFLALDLSRLTGDFPTDDAFNLLKLSIKDAEAQGSLRYAASTFDPYDQIVRDGIYPGGRKLITFSAILKNDVFPLAETVSALLSVGKTEMGRPVEIEFAMDIKADTAHFYLLQIRPIVDARADINENLREVDSAKCVITSQQVLGNGIVADVKDILYVKDRGYSPSKNSEIAREVERINRTLASAGRQYVLIGPGRWGSSDSWLGIPVKWANVSAARIIIECGRSDYRVDPSQGTHFFQNLTSFGVGYFTVMPYLEDGGTFDSSWLDSQPAEAETEHLRLVHSDLPFVVKMDGRKSYGVVMKPEE